jgi:hypothetical protein
MKVYLAGPMSGLPDFNFPAFHAAARALRNAGHEVFSPAEKDLEVWGNMETIRAKANYRECLRWDLNWILDHAEAIALLPGWEKSKGVAIELALAEVLGLQRIDIGAALSQ